MRIALLNMTNLPPALASDGAIGYDCYANRDFALDVGEQKKVGLGFRCEVPNNQGVFLVPQDGLAGLGLVLTNGIETVNRDNRGELALSLRNDGDFPLKIVRGQAIAQMLIMSVFTPPIQVVNNLPSTYRTKK